MNKKIALLGLFTAFAVILSYIESYIPSIGIPGVKLGLANLAVVLVMYYINTTSGIIVSIIRILIIGMFFGNWFSILFSIAGALVSFGVMAILKKTNKFSMVSISIVGGVFHNIAQLVIAIFVVDTYHVIYYIPALIISGIITGSIIGIVSNIIFSRTKSFVKID